jgi:hypothetical protein
VILLILLPVWLGLWVGASLLICPLLHWVGPHSGIWCMAGVVGIGGILFPVTGIALLVWIKNRERRNS